MFAVGFFVNGKGGGQKHFAVRAVDADAGGIQFEAVARFDQGGEFHALNDDVFFQEVEITDGVGAVCVLDEDGKAGAVGFQQRVVKISHGVAAFFLGWLS